MQIDYYIRQPQILSQLKKSNEKKKKKQTISLNEDNVLKHLPSLKPKAKAQAQKQNFVTHMSAYENHLNFCKPWM